MAGGVGAAKSSQNGKSARDLFLYEASALEMWFAVCRRQRALLARYGKMDEGSTVGREGQGRGKAATGGTCNTWAIGSSVALQIVSVSREQRDCGEGLRPPRTWGKWDCEKRVCRIFLPFPPISLPLWKCFLHFPSQSGVDPPFPPLSPPFPPSPSPDIFPHFPHLSRFSRLQHNHTCTKE